MKCTTTSDYRRSLKIPGLLARLKPLEALPVETPRGAGSCISLALNGNGQHFLQVVLACP